MDRGQPDRAAFKEMTFIRLHSHTDHSAIDLWRILLK